MEARDSFGLTYSPSVNKSRLRDSQPREEEAEQLSPNKQSLLQTFKETIMQPLETQHVLSSLTQVDQEDPSLPNPSKKNMDPQSESEEIKASLPSTKEIKKLSSKAEDQNESSKINRAMPRTLSQRAVLTRKLTDAAEFLAHGVEVEKYCFGMEKVEDAILFFSEDIRFMGLHLVAKKRDEIVCMSDCSGITTGFKTARLQFYQESNYSLDEQRCFSLIFQERSYDFVARSATSRAKIVRDLKFLCGGLQ